MKTIATGYLDGKKVNIVRISHDNSQTVIELDNGATDVCSSASFLLDYVDRLQFIID